MFSSGTERLDISGPHRDAARCRPLRIRCALSGRARRPGIGVVVRMIKCGKSPGTSTSLTRVVILGLPPELAGFPFPIRANYLGVAAKATVV
jgi:hypothetical protein